MLKFITETDPFLCGVFKYSHKIFNIDVTVYIGIEHLSVRYVGTYENELSIGYNKLKENVFLAY
jgi:hypothetical protein